MDQKGFVMLLVLFLGFTYVLACVSAVPVTRSLKSVEDNPSSVQSFLAQEMTYTSERGRELLKNIEVEKRMDIESNDYPGTGANNRHEPKTPGRA